jgi:hypothetical protein
MNIEALEIVRLVSCGHFWGFDTSETAKCERIKAFEAKSCGI